MKLNSLVDSEGSKRVHDFKQDNVKTSESHEYDELGLDMSQIGDINKVKRK